ncbi:aryl-sulfate sulfotransferase [Lentibacillus halophilus]|uniref:Aryl-sulfate sulfotransferase n=1 Tax=Lentibacillus halophilus TaxID=295065 RepID=A0ABP3J0R7_9BACI
MKKSVAIFIVLAIVLVIFFVAIEFMGTNETETTEGFDHNGRVEQVSSISQDRLNRQAEVDKRLKNEYTDGSYSFQDPFIELDPYDATPLAALAKFSTPEPATIKVTVEGKDGGGDIQHTYAAYNKEHSVPILGLYPDYDNTVTIAATTNDGETMTTKLTIQTDALPDDFLTIDQVDAEPKRMESGLTFIVPSGMYAYALDHNGDVRWYSSIWNRHVFKRLENGHLLFLTQEDGQDQYNELLEMDMLGKVTADYHVDLEGFENNNPVHHDVIELPNGNFLATVHDTDTAFVQDKMIEIDRDTGETVREFSFEDVFPASFYDDYDGTQADDGDWFHQNAIQYMEEDDAILVSSRHQSLTMKMSYPSGDIHWILASHDHWPESFEKYLLEPQGDDFKFPGGPHSVVTLPDFDNNAETTDYLLFDNNIALARGNEDLSKMFSRGVQYRVNADDRTVEEVWSYGEERGYSMYSNIVGDANYDPGTGNRLITSGYTPDPDDSDKRISRIVEVTDDQPADVVYEVAISGFETGSYRQAYRALRMPIYPRKEWH